MKLGDNPKRGLIKDILLIIFLIAVLIYLKIDLHRLINFNELKGNVSTTWEIFTSIYRATLNLIVNVISK